MVISRKGIDEFLARPMRDSRVAKRLPERRLDSMIADQGLEFVTQPRHAQKVCALLGWKYHRYLFLLGMGGGKSKIVLDQFRNRKLTGEAKRLLVFVPNIVNLGAWEVEARKHAPDLTVASLDADGEAARWAIIEGETDIVVGTYTGLVRLACKIAPNTKGKNRMKPHPASVKRLMDAFCMMSLDECTALRNPNSVWFRVIRALRKGIKFVYALTGTPFDKNPEELWSQFFLIDDGYTLGETLGLYRGAFFKAEHNYFGGTEYKFRHKLHKQLAKRLANCSVRYDEDECQDLPEAVGGLDGEMIRRPVDLPAEQRPYYDKLKTELRDGRTKLTAVDSPYTRMRMVASGWLGTKTESAERVDIVFKENPKMEALVGLLREIPEDEPVIVICWFQTTCGMVLDRLKKEKISALLVNGKTPKKQKLQNMTDFCAGKSRVLVGSTAISKGVNLQDAARFMVFFESPDSTIERRQLERRIWRGGGHNDAPRYFYDLVCRGLVCEDILDSMVTGRKLHNILIDRRRKK